MATVLLVHASSVKGLIASIQGPNMTSTGVSLTTASESVTAGQVQDASQPQGPSSTTIHIPSTAVDIKINASNPLSALRYNMGSHLTPASAKPTKHLKDANCTLPCGGFGGGYHAVWAVRVEQLEEFDASQSHTSDVLIKASPPSDINTPLNPALSTQTIIANSESQNILTSGLTLSKGSAATLDSDTSNTVLAPQTSVTQPSNASGSLSSGATTMHYLSQDPLFLTTGAQTVTVERLSQYSRDSQPLTKTVVITVSGKMTLLASNESAVVMGTGTEAFGPSATAKFGSGSSGTEVQGFSGNALGSRDGLGGSSMMFLVFFVVLLWL